METTQNPSTEVTQPRKQVYESIDASIAKMKLTFNNAMLPEIFDVMLTVGYTTEKIELLKADLAQLEVLCQTQTKEAADKYNETDKLKYRTVILRDIEITNEGINEGINELESLILTFLEKKPGAKGYEIAEYIQKGAATTERYLRSLKDKELIEYKGSRKTGGYYKK